MLYELPMCHIQTLVLLADLQVARTRDRPLVCGEISQFRALTFLALPLSVSLGVLLTFNWNT